jgi:hypothetical protein
MRNKELFIITTLVLGFASAVATTSFDRVTALKDVLELRHVDGKKDEAAALATKLAANSNNEPFVQGPLQEELAGLDASVSDTSLEKSVNFITGKKTELYCEGQGLVEMSGEHNDGSTSHLVLVRTNRVLLPGSYSQVESGDWAYELSDSYRRPAVSELIMVGGGANSYNLKELRTKTNGKTDSGEFSANWSGNKITSRARSVGEGPEPMGNYMAMDFHLWGNNDLGYKVKFEPGFRDSHESSQATATKEIILSSDRTVGELMPEAQVTDSKGEVHSFKNCYPVKYQITMKKIEDKQLVVDGVVNKESVRKVLKKNRKQIRTCFDQALDEDSTLKGSVTMSWDVNDQGKVTETKATSRSLTGGDNYEVREEMIQCMGNQIKKWKFPAAPKGHQVHISYPFTLGQ